MVLFFVSYDIYDSILYIKYYIIGVLEFDIKNTGAPENDMSKSEKYQYDVLLYIISKGEPAAGYEIKEALRMNQPTVRNVCRRLEKSKDVTKENGSRNKIKYGPTWDGLASLCSMNAKMLKEIDTMLDGWFNQPKFIKSLKEDFGEVVTNNPDYAKALVKKMIKHFSRIEEEMEKITDEEKYILDRVFAEQKLLMKYPAERQTALEFYNHVKFYRDNLNQAREFAQKNEEGWNVIDKMNLP